MTSFFKMAVSMAYGSSKDREWVNPSCSCNLQCSGNAGSFNPLQLAGDQTLASVVTQATATGLTLHTTAETPLCCPNEHED